MLIFKEEDCKLLKVYFKPDKCNVKCHIFLHFVEEKENISGALT